MDIFNLHENNFIDYRISRFFSKIIRISTFLGSSFPSSSSPDFPVHSELRCHNRYTIHPYLGSLFGRKNLLSVLSKNCKRRVPSVRSKSVHIFDQKKCLQK